MRELAIIHRETPRPSRWCVSRITFSCTLADGMGPQCYASGTKDTEMLFELSTARGTLLQGWELGLARRDGHRNLIRKSVETIVVAWDFPP